MVVVAALGLLVASCVNVAAGDQAAPPAAGSVDLFCRIWVDARATLLESWSGAAPQEGSDDDRAAWAQALEEDIARYDRVVPTVLRQDWDRAHDLFTRISDVRFTAAYNDKLIRPEHLTMMFGAEGPEPFIKDAEEAIDAIDRWSLATCGDFCTHWGDLAEAARFEPNQDWNYLRENLGRWTGLLDTAYDLVPAEIEEEWSVAAAIQSGYLKMLQALDFNLAFADATEETAAYSQYLGMGPNEALEKTANAFEGMNEWVEANCNPSTAVAGGNGPGRVTVILTLDKATVGETLLMALLPAGTDFASVDSIVDYVAGSCPEVHESDESDIPVEDIIRRLESEDRWGGIAEDLGVDIRMFLSSFEFGQFGVDDRQLAEDLESGRRFTASMRSQAADLDPFEPFRHPTPRDIPEWAKVVLRPIQDKTEYSNSACQFTWEQEAIVDPGPYELYVGSYLGSPGDFKFYVAQPTACAQIPLVVGGDTVVDMPELGPCDIPAIGNPQEVARRSPDLAIGNSSLRVRLASGVGDGPFGCNLLMVLLPSGATLNDVGRGNVWPSAGVEFGTPRRSDVGSATPDRSGLVPMLLYPSTDGLRSLNSHFRDNDASWDLDFPDPVALDPGIYDLRVDQRCPQRPDTEEDADRSCGMVTVDVDGDTIVDLPQLGPCR
jgi:hypothetical protein